MSKVIIRVYELDEYDKLTPKQKAWIDHYIKTRNYTEASRLSGYGGSNDTLRRLGFDNYRKFEKIIAPRLAVIETKVEGDRVNEIIDAFKMWTDIMNDKDARTSDKLKASELLVKAKGGFIERVDMNAHINTEAFKDLTTEELRRLAGK